MGCDSHFIIVGMSSYDAVLLQYAVETQSPITLHGNPEGQLVTGNNIPRIQDQEVLGEGSLFFVYRYATVCSRIPVHVSTHVFRGIGHTALVGAWVTSTIPR